MSLENSRKLIAGIASEREADEYFSGLLKAPDMRADMEGAAGEKWENLSQEPDMIRRSHRGKS